MNHETESYFANRATVRDYAPQALPEGLLEKMLAMAVQAPNTGNMQWYSIIVTTTDQGKQALAPAHFNQPSVTSAAAVLTFCLDLNRFERWCRLNCATPGFENFQSFVAAIIDTSLVAQQFCSIAELNGLGTCYLGTTTYNAPDIAQALELPDRVIPVTTLTVGYPRAEVNGPTWRLPVQAVVHFEKYSQPTDEQISGWYAPLEAESQHFVDENNKQSLAQVFTDIRYPRESAEYFSKVYSDFLAKNRFL